ncbi:MAG: response regulator [Caulobacteraceae bacterium]
MTANALNGLRLLVVEDEALVAMELEDMLGGMGCVVVDVAGTVSRGLALAGDEAVPLDGAILDVNLGGEQVFPVAERLASRGVPFVFCTGYGHLGLAGPFARVPTLAKPYNERQLRDLLVSALAEGRGA